MLIRRNDVEPALVGGVGVELISQLAEPPMNLLAISSYVMLI